VVILFGANLSKCSHHSAAPCGKAYQVPDRLHSPYTMPHRQVATITPKLASSNTHSIAFFAYVGVDAFSFILGTIPAGGSTVMNRKGKWPRGNMPPEGASPNPGHGGVRWRPPFAVGDFQPGLLCCGFIERQMRRLNRKVVGKHCER
jgi:hypothetical protein